MKYSDAIKAFQQAAKLKPGFADTEYNLGNAYLMSGKFSEAADAYQQAISHKRDWPEAENNLGIALTNASPINVAELALVYFERMYTEAEQRAL